jgi:hypothetical protein
MLHVPDVVRMISEVNGNVESTDDELLNSILTGPEPAPTARAGVKAEVGAETFTDNSGASAI